MNIQRKASHVQVYGQSGTGKTSYSERYIIGSHHDRVFIFDHEAEFCSRLHLLPCYTYTDILVRARNERILCFDYSVAWEGRLEASFDAFCSWVFGVCKSSLSSQECESLFVCDELQKVVGPHSCPQPLKTIMQTGRRYCLDSLIMSQQPNEIHNTVRTQATELAVFKLQDFNAQKFVSEIGMNVEEILRLRDLHYIWRNCKTSEVRRGSIDYQRLIKTA